MNASARKAQQIIRTRRAANGKGRRTTLNNAVAAVTADKTVRKGVTAALRKAAKPLREAGELGTVKGKRCNVADGVRGMKHLYTARQVAKIAASYKPRKVEYKTVREVLVSC